MENVRKAENNIENIVIDKEEQGPESRKNERKKGKKDTKKQKKETKTQRKKID